MKRNHLTTTLALLLASATAAGCAADAADPDDDGDGSDHPMPQPDPVPLTPEGKFSVQSDFDIATNLPGTAGTVMLRLQSSQCHRARVQFPEAFRL